MNALKQLAVLVLLAGICGAAYNFANAKTPRELVWVPKIYRGSDKFEEKPKPSTPASSAQPGAEATGALATGPGAGAPTASPGAGAPPVEIGAAPGGASGVGASGATSSPQLASGGEEHGDSAEFEMIDMEHVLEELASGTPFVDARRTKDYEAGHIPGAISISPHEAGNESKISRLVQDGNQAAPLVVYCSNSKECEDSKLIARQLRQAGFQLLMIYTGGFPEWGAQWKDSHPERIVKGSEPGSWTP